MQLLRRRRKGKPKARRNEIFYQKTGLAQKSFLILSWKRTKNLIIAGQDFRWKFKLTSRTTFLRKHCCGLKKGPSQGRQNLESHWETLWNLELWTPDQCFNQDFFARPENSPRQKQEGPVTTAQIRSSSYIEITLRKAFPFKQKE